VILHEDHGTPIVAVSVMYHVGSKNEASDRRGFAHFFEHLLFEAARTSSVGEFSKYVEKAGGVLNANTNGDRTYYYEVLPSNQLELGLWLESERMLHAKVDQVGVDTQREVVKEERRQRYENQPYGTHPHRSAQARLHQASVPVAHHRLHGRPERGQRADYRPSTRPSTCRTTPCWWSWPGDIDPAKGA
jgi:predicted Zn-dependent peptidase